MWHWCETNTTAYHVDSRQTHVILAAWEHNLPVCRWKWLTLTLVVAAQQPGARPGALPQATMHLPAESSTAALPSSLSFSVTAPVGGPGTAIMDSSLLSPFLTAEQWQQQVVRQHSVRTPGDNVSA
jgi:hypothetical protein